MLVPQKTRYAIRAVFELAKHIGQGPVRIADIARAQAIPVRFLEVILSQLKQSGIVDSKRGNEGGYSLVRSPVGLTVGEVIRFVQGPIRAVGCSASDSRENCSLHGGCVFLPMWEKAQAALSDVYDSHTFQYLLEQDKLLRETHVPGYSI